MSYEEWRVVSWGTIKIHQVPWRTEFKSTIGKQAYDGICIVDLEMAIFHRKLNWFIPIYTQRRLSRCALFENCSWVEGISSRRTNLSRIIGWFHESYSRESRNIGISHGNVGDIPMKFDIPRLPRENQRYSWVLGDWVISFFGTHNLKRYPLWPESKLPFVNLVSLGQVKKGQQLRNPDTETIIVWKAPKFLLWKSMRSIFLEILKLV